jgi:MarR family transcriptional regulator, organic hydroperoxide resistance regulator
MNEGLSSGGPADPDEREHVLAHLAELAKSFRAEMPAWVAAELTSGQLRLLFKLSRQGPTSMSGIGEWLGTSLSSVTGTVERLERHGLVERRHGADDRRIVEVHLSDRGRELVADILGIRLESIRRLLGVLDPDELRDLDRLLRLIIERTEGTPS